MSAPTSRAGRAFARVRRFLWIPLVVLVAACALVFWMEIGADAWTSTFSVEPDELASTGRNPYFVLEPAGPGREGRHPAKIGRRPHE
jgi:hypothetical protein